MLKLLAIAFLYSLSMVWTSVGLASTDNWMKNLDDSLMITQISIPGTHDSAADGDRCDGHLYCQAQKYGFGSQLEKGIRFFDIRLAYEDGDLGFYHNIYDLDLNFKAAIDVVEDYLEDEPSEFVIFLIKQEHTSVSPDTFWKRVSSQIDDYSEELFYLYRLVPSVGAARGKIIIMARDESTKYDQGFHVEWDKNTKYYEGSSGELNYFVEDHYSLNNVLNSTKFNDVKQNISLAKNCMSCGDPNNLYITFLSGEADADSRGPAHYADYQNPHTADYLNDDLHHTGPRRGIVVMDFAGDPDYSGDELIEAVIGQNSYAREISGGIGDLNDGGGVAVADINGSNEPDLIVFWIDNLSGDNKGYYRIGWNMGINGFPKSWSEQQEIPWAKADRQTGGGLDIKDIDGNGKPELIVFLIDAVTGNDRGYYRIGWDMDINGLVDTSKGVNGWTDFVTTGSLGDHHQGGGVAVADIDGNGSPELIAFDIANSGPGSNSARYRIGWDLSSVGVASSWSDYQKIPWAKTDNQQGGGLAATDMNDDGIPDLIVFLINDASGENTGYYRIGYMGTDGLVDSDDWTDFKKIPGWFGHKNPGAGWSGARNQGGGVAVANIDGNDDPDLIVFSIDNPSGENKGYYRMLRDVLND